MFTRKPTYQPAHLDRALRRRRLSPRRLLLVGGAGTLAVAMAVAGGVAGYSTFSSQISPSAAQPITSGTVTIAFGATSGTGDELTVGATDIVPGDVIQRGVTLTNSGTVNLSAITLGIAYGSGSVATPLDTPSATVSGGSAGTANEFQFELQSCSVAWTATSLTDGGYSYSCSGTPTTVVASEPMSTAMGSPITLTGLNSLTAGGTDNLVATLTLPTSCPNTLYDGSGYTTSVNMEGISTSYTYTFTGTQQNGTNV